MTPSEIPPENLPAYRDRKVGLVVFGVFTTLAGLFCALLIPLVFWAQTLAARQGRPEAVKGSFGLIVSSYGVLALVLVWLGIGSILARRWARALLLICSWFALIAGLIGFTVLALGLKGSLASAAAAQAQRGSAPPPETVYWITLAFCGFLFLLLPLIWLLFYRSRNVRMTCEVRDPVPRWTDRCPLPVLAIVLWLASSALCCLLLPWSTFRVVPFFGMLITGGPAIAAYLVMGCIGLFAARELYRLEWIGWWLAVIVALLYAISSTLTYLRHDLSEVYRSMNYSPEMIDRISSSGFLNHTWIVWGPWAFTIPLLGYLLYIRKFFARSA